MTLAIEASKLGKTYTLGLWNKRQVMALKSLDLKVEEGQVFGLLGPNGAGKSTTIKLLLNLIRPTSGEAKVFGRSPASVEARAQLGFLPENPAPYEYLTGREFVTLGAQLSGMPSGAITARVKAVIEQVGMAQAVDLQIRRYSKGMIQRISLAQALVHEPKLLILDEPTSGLDVLGRQMIRDIIQQERARGTTVLFCSHIIPDVEALCDRVAIVIGGELMREGSVSQLISNEGTEVEVTLEGASVEAVKALTDVRVEARGERVIVRCQPAQVATLVPAVLSRGFRLISVVPSKYSLEELFLKAIMDSGRKVGSEIS